MFCQFTFDFRSEEELGWGSRPGAGRNVHALFFECVAFGRVLPEKDFLLYNSLEAASQELQNYGGFLASDKFTYCAQQKADFDIYDRHLEIKVYTPATSETITREDKEKLLSHLCSVCKSLLRNFN